MFDIRSRAKQSDFRFLTRLGQTERCSYLDREASVSISINRNCYHSSSLIVLNEGLEKLYYMSMKREVNQSPYIVLLLIIIVSKEVLAECISKARCHVLHS
jgi:hypothetical protein